jgi:hypothetical protein
MKHYISINGSKTSLTDEQVKALGFSIESPLARLVEAVRSGKASEHFSIHDSFKVGDVDYEIIGFNHDKNADDEAAHTVTLMAKTLIHSHQMHNEACEKGWIDTDLRKWLNSECFDQLPKELTQYICPVKKITHNYKGDAYETTDRLYIPSESELFGSAIWAEREDGQRYEAFATSINRIRTDDESDSTWYWTRSAYGGNSARFAGVYSHGYAGHGNATGAHRVPLCFIIA